MVFFLGGIEVVSGVKVVSFPFVSSSLVFFNINIGTSLDV
jgi:hypothetical protein